MADVKMSELNNASALTDTDIFPVVQGRINGKATMKQIKDYLGTISWTNVSNKPFGSLSDDFTVLEDILVLSPAIKSNLHTHNNKSVIDKFSESTDGSVLYNGQSISGVSSWNDISDKPFSSVSNADFIVGEDSVLSIKSDRLHSHSNKDVLDKFSEAGGTVLYNGVEITGFDFGALSAALTGGTLSGITIAPDTTNNTFDITVTGIPEIAIDLDGYWTIDGSRGSNPTKAQGEKGEDGVSPTASVAQTDVGATITITDVNGETTATITNGSDGVSPHIDSSTKHWFIGEADTGIVAEGTTTIQTTAVNYTGSLTIDGWIGDTAPYTQIVNVTGITADISPIIDLVVSDTVEIGLNEITQWGNITKAVTGDGNITFMCYETKPNITLNFKAKAV